MSLIPLELRERIDAFGQCVNSDWNIHKIDTGMACKKNRNKKRLEIVVLHRTGLDLYMFNGKVLETFHSCLMSVLFVSYVHF